ncbi:MAG: CapA family protein [Anaerolineales bacterium]|nr:CapA family protein [Anaerolineales bacterium]
MRTKHSIVRPVFVFSVVLVLVSCAPAWGSGAPGTNVPVAPPASQEIPAGQPFTSTPFQPEGYFPTDTPTTSLTAVGIPSSTPSQTPGITTTPAPLLLWIAPSVPPALRQAALHAGLRVAETARAGTVSLELYDAQVSIPNRYSTWIYALVAPFPTVTDGVTNTDLQNAWNGRPSGPFAGRPLWMTESTLAAFTARWGSPASGAVRVAADSGLLEGAWAARPAWAIVPFEDLEPRWKVLTIDGQSPIHMDFNPLNYPLTITFAFRSSAYPQFTADLPATNREQSRMTVLVMTGVTAMVRATAYRMEQRGILYPGEAVRDVLRSADLTHISNEIPFAEGCPYPNPNSTSLIFCSDPDYIQLLEDVGTDIVELTGNHFQDHGSAATMMTLEMYTARDWPYYGGGRNLDDATRSITVEHNGNRLAFIGCNPVGPEYAWATETRPGAAPCGDYSWMTSEINRLDAAGIIVIATMQYNEYYIHNAPENQVRDFGRLADAGAAIVSGSQAHFPQAIAFGDGSFIHYGLGNLFFDQMNVPVPGTQREFIDRHILYGGRHISTELLTYMLEDYARPRPMTELERLDLLQDIFLASGW